MRTKLLTLTAAAAGLGLLLAGCGNAPGSVAGDPLAVKLIDAETKMQQWDGVELSLTFDGDGALSSASFPCIAMNTAKKPTESFTMSYVKDPDSSSGCSGSASSTVQIDYADGTLYVTDPSERYGKLPKGCESAVSSHLVTEDLAQQFVSEQTSQAKMPEMMKTATEISGDDHNIKVVLDTAAMMKLGKTSIPSGVDPDDIDVTAEAQLDDEGALTALTMTINADDPGSIEIDTRYAKSSTTPKMPAATCVTEGSKATSTEDIKGYLT